MRARRGRFAGCASRAAGAVNPRAVGRAASRTAFAEGAAFDRTMRGSGAGRRGGSAIRGSRARWSTAAVCRVSRSTLGGGFGSALRGSAAATGCRSAPACFVRAGFGSAFGGGAAATGRLRSGACFGRLSLVAGFVSALRGTVASTGGSGLVWVAVTDGAAGGFGASLAAAERSTAGAGLVWFPVTEDLDSGLRSSDAKAGRSTPAGLAWASGGAGFGLCSRGGRGDDRPLGGGRRLRAAVDRRRSRLRFRRLDRRNRALGGRRRLRLVPAGGRRLRALLRGSAAATGRSTVGRRFRAAVRWRRRFRLRFRRLDRRNRPLGGRRRLGLVHRRRQRRLRLRRLGGGGRALTRRGLFRLVVRWWRRWFRFGLRRRGRHDRLLDGRCRLRLVHRRRQRRHRLRRLGGCASALNPGRRGGQISACARLRRGLWGCGCGDRPFTDRFGLCPGVCRGQLRLCFRRRDRSNRRPASGALLPGIFRKGGAGAGFAGSAAVAGRSTAAGCSARFSPTTGCDGAGRSAVPLAAGRFSAAAGSFSSGFGGSPAGHRLIDRCSLPTPVFRCGSRLRLRRGGDRRANHTCHVVGGLRRRRRRLGVQGLLGLRPPVTLGGKPLGVERADQRKRQKACQEQLAGLRTKPFFTHVGHTPAPGLEPAPGYSFENFYRVFTILACAVGVQPGARREPARRCHPTRPT